MTPTIQHRLTQQKQHYENLIKGESKQLLPIEQALGKDYQKKILETIKASTFSNYPTTSTIIIRNRNGWDNKRYYVTKALKELETAGKIIGTKMNNHWNWRINHD